MGRSVGISPIRIIRVEVLVGLRRSFVRFSGEIVSSHAIYVYGGNDRVCLDLFHLETRNSYADITNFLAHIGLRVKLYRFFERIVPISPLRPYERFSDK